MMKLTNKLAIERYYQKCKDDLKQYEKRTWDLLLKANTRPPTKIEGKVLEQLNTFETPDEGEEL